MTSNIGSRSAEGSDRRIAKKRGASWFELQCTQVQKSAAGGLGLGFGVGEARRSWRVSEEAGKRVATSVRQDVEEDKYSKVKELVHED